MVQRHRIYYEDDWRDSIHRPPTGRPVVQKKKWLDVTWTYTEFAPGGQLTGFEVVIMNGTDPDDPSIYIRAPETVGPDVRRYTVSVALGTSLSNARAAVRALYGTAKSAWNIQGVGQLLGVDPLTLGTEQDFADAQNAAAAAAADAANAQAELDDISADSVLHKSEKAQTIREYEQLIDEQPGISASAAGFAIVTEKDDYEAALSALTSYLQGLSPVWDDTSTSTSISRTIFKANWKDVYVKKQALLDRVAEKAGSLADWAEIYGSGKPQDGATVGATAVERAQIRSMRNTFFEDFSDSNYHDYWTKFSGGGSQGYYSGGSSSVGGGAARLYDYVGMHHQEKVPFDPTKLYRIEARVYSYSTGDTSRTWYAGLAGYDAGGNPCNASGSNSYSSQHYVLAANENLVGQGWEVLVAYVKGNAAGNTEYSSARGGNHIGNPAKLQANVRFITPIFYANYIDKLGSSLIDYVKIDVVEVQDQRNLPMVQSSIASLPTNSALSASDNGSSAKISVASHTVQYGYGTINYNSGSITGLSFNKKYYVYCDDPGYQGGSVTYYATTNFPTLAASTWRRAVGTITTPSDGGGGTIPQDPYCVAAGTWLREGLLADHCQAGDLLDCWDTGEPGTHLARIEAVKAQDDVPCVLLTMDSGAQVICSRQTPVTDRDGIVYEAQDCRGVLLGVLHEDEPLVWERVAQVQCVGLQRVYKISVGGISYAAGVDAQHRVITHNIYHKP